jgi:hypothetical protein
MNVCGGGWGWPGLAKKAHYFVKGRSLCGKWLFTGDSEGKELEFRGDDDCAACFKKQQALKPVAKS